MAISTAGKPAYIVNLINSIDFTVALPGFPITGPYSWTGNANQSATVTYSYNVASLHWDERASYISSIGTLSSGQQASFDAALTKWANVANVTFTPTTSSPALTIAVAQLGGTAEGLATPSDAIGGNNLEGADIYMDLDTTSYLGGSEGFETALHEIGHILGLQHVTTLYDQDVSMMSYSNGGVVDAARHALTPMIYDIAAAQFLYGANYSYNSGDNTYTLDGGNKAETIWDGNGTDAISAEGYSQAATIDLRGGVNPVGDPYWSHMGDHYIAIAFDAQDVQNGGTVKIENAYGGSGNDTIYGNYLDNVLKGNGGSDVVYGDAGNDKIYGNDSDVFYGELGADTFYDNGNSTSNANITIMDADVSDRIMLTTLGSWHELSGSAIYVPQDGFDWLMNIYSNYFIAGKFSNGSFTIGDFVISDFQNGKLGIFLVNENIPDVNGTSGNDVITPTSSQYVIASGAGADTINITSGNKFTMLTDFAYSAGDRIDISDFTSINSINDIDISTVNFDSTRITIGDTIIELKDINSGTVNLGYFLSNTLYYGTGSVINGTSGNDMLYGTVGNDTIYCNEGNDLATGHMGNDAIYGWTLNDSLWGGYGQDTLAGDDGADQLNGDSGNDSIFGGTGADALYGADGNDTVNGDADNDTVYGGAGNDSAVGGAGADSVFGDSGNDTVGGGTGNDTVYGWIGNDNLFGGGDDDLLSGDAGSDYLAGEAGNDGVYGGDGVDTVVGGAGNDWLEGGLDNDYFTFANGSGNDTINGFDGEGASAGDIIYLSGVTGFANFAAVQAVTAYDFVNSVATINLGGGNLIYVNGVTQAFTSNDFGFA